MQQTGHKSHFENPNCELPYLKISDLNRNVSAALSPFGILRLYMTDEIIGQIDVETKRYYEQIHREKILKRKWVSIDTREIRAHFRINISMEVVQLTKMRDYWRSDKIINVPQFLTVISLNQFEIILRYLPLSDNEMSPPYDSPGISSLKMMIWKRYLTIPFKLIIS